MEKALESLETLVSESTLFKDYGIYSVLTVAFGASLCVWGAILAIYRIYFHPLAKIPGPKIAAATRWYEFYYDVIKRGKYVYKIEEMHAKYGMIPFQLM